MSKQPLYPHVPKSAQIVRKLAQTVRIDYDTILRDLDWFIEDEQKDAKRYRDFAQKLSGMSIPEESWLLGHKLISLSIPEACSDIQLMARDAERHIGKLEYIRNRIRQMKVNA